MQFGIVLNLLDNYLPLVLIIYAISFKENKFDEYCKSVIRVWTMFYCFKRKHYDKSPLVWVSNVGHWAKNNTKLHKTLQENISCTDEYPVENAHSVIRSQTNSSDDCETISQNAKMIFTSKAELKNFKTAFTPPKTFSFTRNVLHTLKVKAAQLIGHILKLATETEGAKYLASQLDFTSANIKCLPLGCHANKPPDQSCTCDMPEYCRKDSDCKLFTGCFHSFHTECLKGIDTCPICSAHLKTVINKLSSTAQHSIFNQMTKMKRMRRRSKILLTRPQGSMRKQLIALTLR